MPNVGKKKKKPHYSSLWYAVFFNNIEMVETLLDAGEKVNEECGKDRGTVLHLAAKKGFAEIVKLLLKKSADVKKRDKFGNTPLHVGASHEQVALELLNYNADVNAKNSFRETPLHHVISATVVRRMFAKNVYLDIRDRKGESALFKAITKLRRTHLLEPLLTAGADVNKGYGKDSETVLHIAAKKGSTEIVKLLLKNGADVSKRDRSGNTPLHKGAWLESVALELIKYNADVNAINASRETPLHHAVSVAVVESMIARGVDLDVLDINMETALYRATKTFSRMAPNYEYVIKSLILAGANVNQECGEDYGTVLHLAAEKGLTETVKLLLENGADVNKRDMFENTPLHRGAGHEGVALELIKRNANLNAKNVFRETPLHYAGTEDIFESMVATDVALALSGRKGETAQRYSSFVQEVLSTAESKTILAGGYGKTVTVDDLVFERVCIVKGKQKCFYFQGSKRAYSSLGHNLEICESYVKFTRYCDILKSAKINHDQKKKSLSSILTGFVGTKYTKMDSKEDFSCGQLSNIRLNRNGISKSYKFACMSKQKMAGLYEFLEDEVLPNWECNPVHISEIVELERTAYDAKEDKTGEWYLGQGKKKFKKKEINTVEKKVRRKQKTRLNSISGYKNLIDMIRRYEEDDEEACYFADQDMREEECSHGRIWGYYNKTWCRYKGRNPRCCCVKHLSLRSEAQLYSVFNEKRRSYFVSQTLKKPKFVRKQKFVRKPKLIIVSIEMPGQKVRFYNNYLPQQTNY